MLVITTMNTSVIVVIVMFGNHLENTNKHVITITEIHVQKIDHHMSKTQIAIGIAVVGIHLLLTEIAG